MNISILLIVVFIAFSLFYYFQQKAAIRQWHRRERLKEKQNQLLNKIINESQKKQVESEK